MEEEQLGSMRPGLQAFAVVWLVGVSGVVWSVDARTERLCDLLKTGAGCESR